jgi:hypothetical protein
VTTLDEENFLRRTFGSQLGVVWLGGFADQPRGPWQWITGEPWKYTRWLPGEPSGSTVNGEPEIRVAFLRRQPAGELGWNDLSEHAESITGYLLEWED